MLYGENLDIGKKAIKDMSQEIENGKRKENMAKILKTFVLHKVI